MQSLVSLENYSPDLQQYLQSNSWPVLMEALISGLTIMLPDNPWEFVENSLLQLKDQGCSNIQWDMFIDPSLRPQHSLLHRGMLDSIMDETDLPTEEMLEAAFNFRRKKLFHLCYGAWIQYHLLVREENEVMLQKLQRAQRYYTSKYGHTIVTKWHNYSVMKRKRREEAIALLIKLFQLHIKKTRFQSWKKDTEENLKAKQFFLNRGRGEYDNEDKAWYWPEGEDPISLFPRDVSIKIFSHVGIQGVCRCAQVCRSWRDMTEDTRLWNKIDLSPLSNFLTDKSVIQLLKKWRPLLGHLCLQKCSLLSSESFRFIGHCQNLQDLNLSECQDITDDVIKSIAISCSGLFYLNLSHCYVTDSIIRLLTKYCISLNYLSLAHCTQFTGKGLQSIMAGKGCRKLIHLDLSGCTQLTQEALQFIGQGLPILHTLILDDVLTLADEALLGFVAHCHTLRHISLLGGSSLSDRAFKHLAIENRKLKSIKIENNDVITDVSLRALAKACRDLQVVCLPGCSRITDQGLKLIGSLKKLHVLNIADCHRVSDAGIRYIVENASGPLLRELNLTNCTKLSDVTPLRISQYCHQLTHLNVSYCDHISDTGVELIAQISSLIDLDITGCGVSDQGVAALRHSQHLKHLGLAELIDLSDDGLTKMARGLNNLETIDLSGCEALTDASIQVLAFNCQLLRSVHLSTCPLLGDKSIKYLAQGCTWIDHIDMSGTNITDQALRHLRKECHHLKILDILSCVHVSNEAVVKLQKTCHTINYSTDPPQYTLDREGLPNLPVESMLNRL